MSPTSNRPLLKVIALLAIVSVAFWISSYFPDLMLTVIISALLAFVLKPLVVLLEFRFGVRRPLAIAIVFVTSGGLVALAAIELVPLGIERLRLMYATFREFPFDLKLNEMALSFASNMPFIEASSVTAKVNEFVRVAQESMGSMLERAASFLVTLAIVPFVTYFVLAEGDSALKKTIERIPNKYFEMSLMVLNRISNDLVGYLRGWILDSLIIGLLSIAGYLLIGIDYAIMIGIVAGVANLVPYLGPIAGAVPALVVSLTQYGDFSKALPIAIVTLSIQMIDNIIVQPICFAKTVDMHPVTVIFVLIIGNELLGIAGMLLAIPIATILKAIAVETYWGLKHYRITS